MKFLLDQNLSPQTTLFLKKLKLQAVDVREVGLFSKTDEEIYAYALKHKLIIITYDQEFAYDYLSRKDLEGLILLRIHPQILENIHNILKIFFSSVKSKQIKNSLIVIEKHRFRIRPVQP